jgi:hypothetical protein
VEVTGTVIYTGLYGGAANPLIYFGKMIASLHDDNNHIIPGFMIM